MHRDVSDFWIILFLRILLRHFFFYTRTYSNISIVPVNERKNRICLHAFKEGINLPPCLSQRMIIHSLICFAISFFYTTYSNIYCTSEWKKEWIYLHAFTAQRMIISSSASFEGLVLDSFNGDLLNEPYLRCNFSSTTSIKSTNLLLIFLLPRFIHSLFDSSELFRLSLVEWVEANDSKERIESR